MSELKLKHAEQTYLPSSKKHVKRFVKSRNSFMKMLDENDYTMIGQYTGVDNHVVVICPDGHEWKTCSFSSFKKGVRCRVCAGQCTETNKNNFYENLKKENYTLLSEYINVDTNVTVICDKGHIWDTCSPFRFNKGARCRICDGQCSNEAKERFYNLLEERGDVCLTDYEGANTKVIIQFGKCGHIVDSMSPNRYKNRKYCPKCSATNKESRLASYTKQVASELFEDVEFEYNILKNEETSYYLPFDIYIPSLNCLIEVNGHQHYEYNTLFHKSEKDFIYRQKLDKYKKDWAIKNDYVFIEIDIRKHDEKSVGKMLNELKLKLN